MESVRSAALRRQEPGAAQNSVAVCRSLDAFRAMRQAGSVMRGAEEFSTCVSLSRTNLDALAEVVRKSQAFVRCASERKLDAVALSAELATPAFILSLAPSLERIHAQAVEARDSDALKSVAGAAAAVVNRVTMNQALLSPENYPEDVPAARKAALDSRFERAELLMSAVDVALRGLSSRYQVSQ